MADSTTASRIRQLRRRLGLTQEEVTARAIQKVPSFRRDYVSKVENGRNKGTSSNIREGLAFAFGVQLAEFNRYLAGELGVEELTVLPPSKVDAVNPPSASVADLGRNDGMLESLLFDVRVQGVHEVSDFDNARRVVREVPPFPHDRVDLSALARAYLDAARSQRVDGLPTTTAAILNRALIAKVQHARAPSGEAGASGKAAPRSKELRGAERA